MSEARCVDCGLWLDQDVQHHCEAADLPSGPVMTAVMRAVQAYEPGATRAITDNPGALLSVMLETAKRALKAAGVTAAWLAEAEALTVQAQDYIGDEVPTLIAEAVLGERERIREHILNRSRRLAAGLEDPVAVVELWSLARELGWTGDA